MFKIHRQYTYGCAHHATVLLKRPLSISPIRFSHLLLVGGEAVVLVHCCLWVWGRRSGHKGRQCNQQRDKQFRSVRASMKFGINVGMNWGEDLGWISAWNLGWVYCFQTVKMAGGRFGVLSWIGMSWISAWIWAGFLISEFLGLSFSKWQRFCLRNVLLRSVF